MPSTSIDTFFACIIIVTAALIATAFVSSTMQTRIAVTEDVNKASYLKGIANHILTSAGDPFTWGTSSIVPVDFGLAATPSTIPYEIDIDKITRLNTQNNYALSYFDTVTSAKLNNLAMGITISQIMSINIQQSSNSTSGDDSDFSFAVLTSVESKPVSASLNCYIVGNNSINNIANTTSQIGLGYIDFRIPTTLSRDAMLIVFARSSFDDRITSYAIYNFASSSQESTPGQEILNLSPLNYTISLSSNSSGVTLTGCYLFSYEYSQNLQYIPNSTQYQVPNLIDKSPFVIVTTGSFKSLYFQEWTTYPQVPLKAGSSFERSEQNIFSYIVTIKDTLYKLNISLGDTPP